jgi:UDP-N-acetylglucosamine acyltransferase
MIDKHAIIDSSAIISENVKIGPYAIIGANVEIGEGTEIASHVVITGRTKIGRNNKIFPFVSIGADPQDLKYRGEDTILEIGDNNVFRECCTVNRGTAQGGGITRIGNHNLVMAYVHIAHDCILGNEIVLSNNTTFAGHVIVKDYVVFGGFAAISQFCTIGAYSFIGATTGINKDVLPYTLVSSHHGPAKTYGLNVIGLKRRGFSLEKIKQIEQAYYLLCKDNVKIKEALPKLEKMAKECSEVQLIVDMLQKSKHGVIR